MKKNKILSLVTALALSVSMLPSAISAANSNVIWEETFNGSLSGYDVTNCEITDGVLKNATATGSRNDGGFNFATLDAKAEGKIRFKYDVKTDNGNDVSKSEIKTNGANIPLLYYWYGGIREVTDPNGGTGAEFGYEWYTNDIVMDFDAGKITVNVTKTETGEVVLSNYVINNDFAGITTIKGVDIWGWDSDRSQEKYYDNFLMEYVDPYLIYAEDYNEDVKFQHTAGTAPTVVNGVVQTAASGESGFSFDTLNAAVADAPLGKVRVRFDFNSPDPGLAATKMTLKTNSGNITFLSYGVYGAIRDDALSDATGNPGFTPNAWHDNDIVFDFENNKIIYNVTVKETGAKVLDGLELSKDLSGITHVKGFELFGWAGTTYFDNLVIEYVVEETPDEPEFSADIYSEDYNGDVSFQQTAGTAPTVVNGVVQTAASGESGFSFDTLNAAVADAPTGKIRVRFDFKSHDPGLAATKMTLKTNSGNITFLSYGVYGAIRDDALSDATGNPGFTPNAWHDNDIVFDFENNKIIYNVTVKETGAKVLDGLELSKDLSGITHVKGFDLFGWAGTTYFDNLVIEYVVDETPDEPGFVADIYSEDYEGNVSFQHTEGAAPTVVNGVVQTAATEGGFWFDDLNAAVADAPLGQVRVKFDFKSHDPGLAATKMTLKTNAKNITFLSYGVYGAIRDDVMSDATGNPGFTPNVWHDNDVIFDFANNKIIYNVTNKETGEKVLDGFEISKDLSGITHVKGFDLFGWAGTTYFDNLVIEYVVEEETPDTPDEPEFVPEIYTEEFDGKTLTDIAATIDNAPSIVDGVAKLAQSGGSGFKFTGWNAEAKGQIRVKFEMNAPSVDTAATTTKIHTNAGSIPLVSYGVWGGIRPSAQDEPLGTSSFTGDVWYENDIILDFDNNKIIYTVTNMETGEAALSAYEVDYDFSAYNKITGFEMYGWAGPAKLDNLVVKYVTEEDIPDEPEAPDEPEFVPEIYTEEFDGKTLTDIAATIDNAPSIVDGVAKLAQSGGSGFKFTGWNAEAKGQIRVKFETNSPNVDLAATTTKLHTDAGSIPLVSYGVWGGIRPTADGDPLGTSSFTGDVWYENDIILDFDNNKIIYTVTNMETGEAALSAYEVDYDFSAFNKITGFEMYGWAGPAKLDNLVVKYVTEEDTPDEPELVAGIYTEEFDGKTLTDIAATIDNAPSIVDGVAKLAQSGGSGFKITSLNAEAKGQIRVKFEMNAPSVDTAATTTKLHTDAGSIPLVSYGVWGGIRPTAQDEPLGTSAFVGDVWYENDIILDFDANKIIYTVTNMESGEGALSEYAVDYDLSAVNKITGFEMYGWAGPAMLDNLVIEYSSKDPYVSTDNIKIYTGDKEEKHASVTPGADKIVIDFVGVLKESSLNNAVVIKNVTDNKDVLYTGAVVGSRYIMTLREGLAASKQFRITISADVENIFGVKLGGEHAFSFATNEGYIDITSISLKQNDNDVESLAELTAGQEAKVTINFKKTSNDERKIKLIYAYYKGTLLVKKAVKTITIEAADKQGVKEDIHVIEELEGITSVSVMVWENFQTIKPLCEDIKLN